MENLKVNELVEKFGSVDAIKAEIRNVQSVKCRLNKQKSRADYAEQMQKTLMYEQALKNAKSYMEPKKVTTTTMSDDDIKNLNYDETVRAIKSIQSKKCLTQFDDPDAYELALKIEEKLKEHKNEVKPIEETVVKKSSITNLIHHLESQEQNLDKDYVIKLLQEMVDGTSDL